MAKQTEFDHPPFGHVAILGYDSADDHWHAIYVDDSGRLQIDVAVAEPLDVREYQYDGSTWRASNLLWGYNDRLSAALSYTTVATGFHSRDLLTVPANYVYVVNATMSQNSTTAGNQVHMLNDGTTAFTIKFYTTAAAGAWSVNDNISYALKAGDKVQFQFYSCAIGDVLYYRCWGYMMKVNM